MGWFLGVARALFYLFKIYLTRKCLNEIKNLLYKSVLAKTAAVARHTKFRTIQHKTVTDNIILIFLNSKKITA